MPRTLARRLRQLARYPILGIPAYLLALFAVVIWLVDTSPAAGSATSLQSWLASAAV